AYNSSTHTATLTPSAALSQLTAYTASLTTSIADTNAQSLPATVSSNFTISPDPALAHAAYGFSEGSGTTTADASANGNGGTLLNGTAWTTGGRDGNGVVFDGVDDKVQVNGASSLDLTTAFTFEAWVYPTSSNMTWKILHRNALDSNGSLIGYSFALTGSSHRPLVQMTTSTGSVSVV